MVLSIVRLSQVEDIIDCGEGQADGPVGILFHAPGDEASQRMLECVRGLEEEFTTPGVAFAEIDIRNLTFSTTALGINTVPRLWVVQKGKVLKEIEGFRPSEAANALEEAIKGTLTEEGLDVSGKVEAAKTELQQKLTQRIEAEGAIVFLTGKTSVDQPFLDLLTEKAALESTLSYAIVHDESPNGLELSDALVAGRKASVPCFCCAGGIFGSATTVKEHMEDIRAAGEVSKKAFLTRLEELTKKAEVVLVMKGTKERPFCRYSKAMVALLNDCGIEFDYFDVFSDERVREGLKKFSDWPTYPQLYVKGEFMGGLDVVQQMLSDQCGKDVAAFKKALGI